MSLLMVKQSRGMPKSCLSYEEDRHDIEGQDND